MARTKTTTQNKTKIRRTPRRNRHLERKNYFISGFSFFLNHDQDVAIEQEDENNSSSDEMAIESSNETINRDRRVLF